jgi:hypothetical protein
MANLGGGAGVGSGAGLAIADDDCCSVSDGVPFFRARSTKKTNSAVTSESQKRMWSVRFTIWFLLGDEVGGFCISGAEELAQSEYY